MDEDIRQKYIEAGRITAKAREHARQMAEPGTELERIAEAAEQLIRDEGAQPAFPVNLSVNEEAAHYTPTAGDDRVLEDGDLLKIDVGAHVDGYIGDTAVTVDLGDHDALTTAARDALEAALAMAEAGQNVGEIGNEIQTTVNDAGFKPVRNLGGHGLDQYVQHSGERIPNAATNTDTVLEAGNAYAIEPFATDGAGKVDDGGPGNIYRYEGGSTRDRTARKILGQVEDQYRTLPFTSRWFDISEGRKRLAFRNLVKQDIVHEYDVLKEIDGGMVAQAEHTILVFEDEVIVTTER